MIKIVFEKENKRAVAYDQDLEIGECCYEKVGELWNITHTEVDSSYRGQGIAKKLVECIIEEANKNNIKLTSDCSYAKKLI